MIVLLPVSRFRVPYDLARGKPYSRLEQMALNAVADGGATLRSLADAFRVHDRLLVEAVVTLVNAGWVAVQGGPQTTFVLTGAGHAALSGDREPVSVIVETARPGIVIMDRYSGQVARQSEARPYRREDLAAVWADAPRLPIRNVRNTVDEAQVQRLLHRDAGEWVRRIGRIEEISRDAHWLPLDVDVDARQVVGLPPPWRHALSAPALSAAASAATDGSNRRAPAAGRVARPAARRFPGVANVDRAQRHGTALTISSDDFVRGTIAHTAVLTGAIGSARTSVALVVPYLGGPDAFEALAVSCAPAIARGVRVDLLVGSVAADPTELIKVANRIGYRSDARQGRSLLRTRVTGSGASLVLWDQAPGELVGLVTDYSWAHSQNGADSTGVRVLAPFLCADLARAVASLWTSRGGDEGFASEPERWRLLASDAEEQAARGASNTPHDAYDGAETMAELLIDDECVAQDQLFDTDVAVGKHVADPAAGEGARRGIQLLLRRLGALDARSAIGERSSQTSDGPGPPRHVQ